MGRFGDSSIYGSAQVLWLHLSSILQRDAQFTFLALLSLDHVKDRACGIDNTLQLWHQISSLGNHVAGSTVTHTNADYLLIYWQYSKIITKAYFRILGLISLIPLHHLKIFRVPTEGDYSYTEPVIPVSTFWCISNLF